MRKVSGMDRMNTDDRKDEPILLEEEVRTLIAIVDADECREANAPKLVNRSGNLDG